MNRTQRENIENLCRVAIMFIPETSAPSFERIFAGLVRNLKVLRDRTAEGDMTALGKFFALYVFDDNQGRDIPYRVYTRTPAREQSLTGGVIIEEKNYRDDWMTDACHRERIAGLEALLSAVWNTIPATYGPTDPDQQKHAHALNQIGLYLRDRAAHQEEEKNG